VIIFYLLDLYKAITANCYVCLSIISVHYTLSD